MSVATFPSNERLRAEFPALWMCIMKNPIINVVKTPILPKQVKVSKNMLMSMTNELKKCVGLTNFKTRVRKLSHNIAGFVTINCYEVLYMQKHI